MKRSTQKFMLAAACVVSLGWSGLRESWAAETAPLPLVLPQPTLKGTPDDVPKGPNVEPISEKLRAPFLAPKGVKNVALGKKVSCSVEKLYTGSLPQITDGKKEAYDEQVVEMRKGTQWVQIDLEKEYPVSAVVIWHDHRWLQVFFDVVVQTAEDAEFTKNVKTVFNNDYDNSSGFGIGTDKEYFENHEGKLIQTKGLKARYLRCYSKGSHLSAYNVYQEIEVYALP